MTDVRINASSLAKTYKRAGGEIVNALDHVDLAVEAGEFVVLLGPSGCGKTTLLRSIAGLETPESGEISVDGRPVYASARSLNIPPERRNINMMFQSYALWPHMTVFQNVAYPLVSNKVPKSQIADKVEAVLARVGIPELAESHPADLSGGQQQRVALARALVFDPSCILFDEPLSNVDAKVREQLRIELVDMHRKMRFSALYVTHDQTEAMQLADRLVVMRKGRIEQQGRPEEIYRRPVNRYVANFIGVSNEVLGTVVEVATDHLDIATGVGTIRTRRIDGFAVGDEVALILRPEALHIHETAPASGTNSWTATVQTEMFAGSHTEYVVSAGDATMQIWDSARSGFYAAGSEITVTVAADDVHVVPRGDA